jgi:PPOX class probable F420-dependent enzyme
MADTLEGAALDLVKQGKNFAHVTIPREDGDPQVVLVWAFADDAGNIKLNSAEGRAWPENLRRAGRAIITVANHENPYEYVSVTGRLAEDTHDGAEDDIDYLAQKYLGEDRYPWRAEGEQRVTFTLAPERVRHQGAS